MLETQVDRAVRFGYSEYHSKTQARKKFAKRKRLNQLGCDMSGENVDDVACLLVELGRLAALDEGVQGRIVGNRTEGEWRTRGFALYRKGSLDKMLAHSLNEL